MQLPDGRQSRKKTSYLWLELKDTCAYHAEFGVPKLLWIELAELGRFAYDENGVAAEVTALVMTGHCMMMKYWCSTLNTGTHVS